MKRKIFFAAIIAMFMVSVGVSCSSDDQALLEYIEREKEENPDGTGDKDNDPKDGDYDGIVNPKPFSVDQLSFIDVESAGLTTPVITITAHESVVWSITTADAWLTPSVISGEGNATFTITVDKVMGLARTGKVTLATIDQEVATKLFDISVSQLSSADIPDLTYDIASLTEVEDPSIALDNGKYYLFSSNRTLSGATNSNGLMLRTSTDLINFKFKGYVLDKTFVNAKAELLKIDPAINPDMVRIASPGIFKVDGVWRLYYCVNVNSEGASVIGYATSTSLSSQVWIDRGVILSSGAADAIKACHPSFIETNGEHWLVYGYGGTNIIKLDKATGKVAGSAVNLFTDGVAGDSQIAYINGAYYMFVTMFQQWNSANIRVLKSTSGIMGPYQNHSGTGWQPEAAFVTSNFVEGSTSDYGYRHNGGPSVIQSGSKWYMVQHAQKGLEGNSEVSDNVFKVIVREMGLLNQSSWPTASLFPYNATSQTMTATDIVGTWQYTTLWYLLNQEGSTGLFNHKPTGNFKFNSDNTVSGDITGTWSFNTTSNELKFISTSWAGEVIALTVFRGDNNVNNAILPVNFAAHGYNHTYGAHPAVLMRKKSNLVL